MNYHTKIKLQVLLQLLIALLVLGSVLAGMFLLGATAERCYQQSGSPVCPQTVRIVP
jgi:hypothetical protein